MEIPGDRDLAFSGTARVTACSQLEGRDRCAAVQSELKRLFAAKASPFARGQRLESLKRHEQLPKLLVRPASSPARPRNHVRMEGRVTTEGWQDSKLLGHDFDTLGSPWLGHTLPASPRRTTGYGERPLPSCSRLFCLMALALHPPGCPHRRTPLRLRVRRKSASEDCCLAFQP
eukprot:symbB.v1.2.014338.t1/scaffold1047.1/size141927/4